MSIETGTSANYRCDDYPVAGKRAEGAFCVLFLLIWTRHTIISFALQMVSFIPMIGGILSMILYPLSVVVALVASWPYLKVFLGKADLLLLLAVLLLYFGSFIHVDTIDYLWVFAPDFFFSILPLYFIGLAMKPNIRLRVFGVKKSLFEWLNYASVAGIVVFALYQMYYLGTGRMANVVNSSSSTYSLASLCFVFYYAFHKKSVLYFTIAIVGLVFMISYGIRTNILAVAVMIILSFLYVTNKKKRRFWVPIVILSVYVVYSLYAEEIVSWMERLFSQLGFSMRVFDFLAHGNVTNLSNREFVYQRALGRIMERPILGYGLLGDRLFGSQPPTLHTVYNYYSHNLFLELLVDFGIIFGLVLSVTIVVLLFKGYRKMRRDRFYMGIFLVLFCREFVMLMLSGSYLTEGLFFMLIGLCIQAIRTRGVQKEMNHNASIMAVQ